MRSNIKRGAINAAFVLFFVGFATHFARGESNEKSSAALFIIFVVSERGSIHYFVFYYKPAPEARRRRDAPRSFDALGACSAAWACAAT